MKLEKIDIKNYRSIKDAELIFDHNCLILVGKNEAGKSNILKAIAGALSQKAFPFSASDKRKSLKSEKTLMGESIIKLRFSLSESEFNNVFSSLLKENIKKCFTIEGKEVSLKEYVARFFSAGVWVFDFDKMIASGRYYAIDNKINIQKSGKRY
jgi:predicted ATP-dependent endonuclease of OLD family